MALATRCPACDTVFRISTAQAAAKGGMVRCGHCTHVFNSLDALVRVEDLDVLDETSVALPTPPPEPEVPPSDEMAQPVTVEPVDDTAEPVPVDAEPAPLERPMSEWWLPDPGDRHAPRPASEIDHDLPATGDGPRDDAGRTLAVVPSDSERAAPDREATSPDFMRPDPPAEPARIAVRRLFAGLALLALVVLLGQAAYLWRDELAVRWSPARPWLAAACVPLRCTVDYPAHLDAITIESAAVQATGANLDVYVLTALLRNRDSIDIRYPHLELVLTDVQDRPILRRALRPEDYLSPDLRTDRSAPGFAAGSEMPVRVMFELSDLRFTGYRLERFYP